MSKIPFIMVYGPFKHTTTRGEITVSGVCSGGTKHDDSQKVIVSPMFTHISIDINTEKENFHKTWDFKEFVEDVDCFHFIFEQITKFEKTGKML